MNDLQRLIHGLQIEKPMGGDSHWTGKTTRADTRYTGAATSATTGSGASTMSLDKMTEVLKGFVPPGVGYAGIGTTGDWLGDFIPTHTAEAERKRLAERKELESRSRERSRVLETVQRTMTAIKADHPHLFGGRLIASGGGTPFERLGEILNVAGFDRDQFGYGRHSAYQAHLERLAKNWGEADHRRLMAHAATLPAPELAGFEPKPSTVAKKSVSDARDVLGEDLEAALQCEAGRRVGGEW